jgi:hypothetical protein
MPIYFAPFVFPLPFCPFDGLVEAAGAGNGVGTVWAAGVAPLTRVMIKYPANNMPRTIALRLM